eukprot:COSAG04_NODE_850_length_9869_cov_13.527636_8_plen_39_part_00
MLLAKVRGATSREALDKARFRDKVLTEATGAEGICEAQ